MKEFVEKLISRLGKFQEISKVKGIYGEYRAYSNAIEIVNQLAEEYINTSTEHINCSTDGWIPCSEEEEPNEYGQYIVYVQHYTNKDLFNVTVAEWFGEWKINYEWNIIAWQPLPSPYTPPTNSEIPNNWQQQTMSRFERVE